MDINKLKELLEAFDNSKTNVLEYETEEFRIYLDKSAQVTNQPIPTPQPLPQQTPQALPEKKEDSCETEGELIRAQIVGTFYQAPSPDSPPFVKVGDKVKEGQTLCIIEAMKIMNEIPAEFDCEILEVLVEDGQPVEYDTPLFRVKRLN